MARSPKKLYYTVPEYADKLLVEVEATQDNQAAREQALDEIMQRIDDDEDSTLSQASFPDGLGVEQLVLVEPPAPAKPAPKKKRGKFDRELEPIEVAAAEIAQFSMMRVELQRAQEQARPYLSLIEALFDVAPLTEEQMEEAVSEAFADALSNLATVKVEYDKFHDKAEQAWELLKPAIAGEPKQPTSNGNTAKKKVEA